MLALDVILLILTAVCTVYCSILSKRIAGLHTQKDQVVKLLNEFEKVAVKVEGMLSSTEKLTNTAKDDFEHALELAESKIQTLKVLANKSDQTCDDLELALYSGNRVVQAIRTQISEFTKVTGQSIADVVHETPNNEHVEKNTDNNIYKYLEQYDMQLDSQSQSQETAHSDKINLKTQKDYYEFLKNKQKVEHAY